MNIERKNLEEIYKGYLHEGYPIETALQLTQLWVVQNSFKMISDRLDEIRNCLSDISLEIYKKGK